MADTVTDMPSPLATIREEKGLSQEALADAARVGVRTIRRIEAGGEYSPGIGTLVALARALGVDVGELIHEPDATPATNGAGQVEPVTP